MSAQSVIYDKILQDLKDDKTFDAVTTKRLFYYLETIKDITGGGGTFTYGDGVPSGGVAGDYYIQSDATSIWFNAAGIWTVILSPAPIESSWTNALGRIGSIIPNQAYKVNNDDSNLPAGVDYILIWGLDAGAYNTNGQAYLTGLGVFPCDYDVIGDKILVILKQRLMIEDFGGTLAVTKVYDDFLSTSYTISIITPGTADYEIACTSSNWQIGSDQTILRQSPYYNVNQDPCAAYATVTASDKIEVKGFNFALGGIIDTDGQLQAHNLYIDIESIIKN